MINRPLKDNTELSTTSSKEFVHPVIGKVDIAIFSAMPEELEYFNNVFAKCKSVVKQIGELHFTVYEYNNKKIVLAQTGLGTTFAASVLTLIHTHFSPEYVFLCGTAGGINSRLALRDVIIVENAFEAEIQDAFKLLKNTPFESCLTHPLNNRIFPPIYSANKQLLEVANEVKLPEVRMFKGTVVSSNTFPAPQELFEKIKSANPYSIDMETSAFYQVAWLLNIPVLAVRGISNLLNQNGTDDKIHESDVKGSAEAAAKVVFTIIISLILRLNSQKELHSKSLSVDNKVNDLIRKLNLQPHPEGGHYARFFQSADEVKSINKDRYNDEVRYAGTSIYYLLKQNDFSAWHCLQSDEIWHYYKGSPVKIHVIDMRGDLKSYTLGDPILDAGASFQIAITSNNWFAAEIIDKSSYSLVGCTVNPGFDFKDFKLGDRRFLAEKFPQHRNIIKLFTRVFVPNIDSKITDESNNTPKLVSRL